MRPCPRFGSTFSTSTRESMSDQVSSAAWRMPVRASSGPRGRARRCSPCASIVASRSMPAWRWKASATVRRSGGANGSQVRSRKRRSGVPRGLGSEAQKGGAIVHQHGVVLPSAVPFQHGEFRGCAAARVRGCARHGRRRGSGSRPPRAASSSRIRARCAGSIRLRCCRRCRWHRSRRRAGAPRFPGWSARAAGSTSMKPSVASQARSAAWMRLRASRSGRRSAWRAGCHQGEVGWVMAWLSTGDFRGDALDAAAPAVISGRIVPQGSPFVKVIASSLRKGNVVELDGKLYAVLTAANFHPGKGTPDDSGRHAPHFGRGEGERTLAHDRDGREGQRGRPGL